MVLTKGEIQQNPQPREEIRKDESCLGFPESQGMKSRSLEDESDLIDTTQGGGEETLEPGTISFRKRTLVEIFAVLLLEKEDTLAVHQVLQESLQLFTKNHHGVYQNHLLSDISPDKLMQIDSQCYLILNGPHTGVEILGFLGIIPCYDLTSNFKSSPVIWDDIDGEYDIFICDWRETLNGFMAVKFAVYRDGLEAHLEITISHLELHGMPLDLYGTVTTSNSAVSDSEAKSYLLNHIGGDNCAILDLASFAKAEIPLPLSRRVTVIPRESTLIVDLNLFIRGDSGDISIAKDSVSFHAATRSNIVEEHIIKGSYAKLKVKVTWVEALELDREGEERNEEVMHAGEVREHGEVIDDMDTISEESETESDQGTESEDISGDSSHPSLKIRRCGSQEDVSTGVVDYYTAETMDIADGGQGKVQDIMASQVPRSDKHYLEVFSVKLLDIENLKLDEIYGLIMIHTAFPPRLLFRRLRGDPSKFDSQGFAILEGPRRCGWNVDLDLYILPLLFKYQEFEFTGEHGSSRMWRRTDKDSFNNLLCTILDNDFGRIEVNFAVYLNSVWAHLTVTLTDCSFSWAQVHGTITASNSMLQNPKAVSIVFKKEKTEADHVNVGPGKEISLPLSRSVVALPLGSLFTVRVDIFSEGESIIHHPFKFQVALIGEIEQTSPGNGCGVRINVKFNNKHCYYDKIFD